MQHRMPPAILSLVRSLTYPDLTDAPSTTTRPPLKGLRDRVVFIDHRQPELAMAELKDRRDQNTKSSKQNIWEVSMVLKIIRFLGQQGYGAAKQVVLTPYLGQLNLLRRELQKDNDPVLNDLDSFDLVNAGLMSRASAYQTKQPLKISTIDNYQGEECENGFMAAPERLNVLLSRARQAVIIIGNSDTFLSSSKGADTWKPFFKLLAKDDAVFDGFPVRCERHPEREAVMREPSDFDQQCPDGGYSAPCGIMLKCGLHQCPQKCHAVVDHSKMLCQTMVRDRCPKDHPMQWRCPALRPVSCAKCDAELRAAEKKREIEEKLDKTRQEKQAAYAKMLAELDAEIERERQTTRDKVEEDDRTAALEQRKLDLKNARAQAFRYSKATGPSTEAQSKTAMPGYYPQASRQEGTATRPETGNAHSYVDTTAGGDQDEHETGALADWAYQKEFDGAKSEEIDELTSMIGLENVKEDSLCVKARVDLAVRQSTSLRKERFGVSLVGNPGTGKTTVARLCARFLSSAGALPGSEFVETTGSKLANEGVQGCRKILDNIKAREGGALFIDEAYQLVSGSSFGGAAVLGFLLAEVENLTGKVHPCRLQQADGGFLGIPNRFPKEMRFSDYEDDDPLSILNYGLKKRYGGRMKVEKGKRGLYARIVARRIGRGRGKEGFGNVRAVEIVLSSIADRQARRLRKEDLIGPEPVDVLTGNRSWKSLQGLIGLSSVKESVRALFSSIDYNYGRELEEKPLMDFSLNKVFFGSPGTGKTTVAKLYGQILADMGLLSSGEVIIKTPADFVGSVIGASEANTKGILSAAEGKVLVIDEAHGLYGGGSGSSDPYKTAIIDTIVAEVQSVPGDDRCVLLLGYKDQMQTMFQNVNPGLARRFPIDSGFHFEDFDDDEMASILDMKLKSQQFTMDDAARKVALDVLSRMRNRPNFGNAGQVDILLNDAKIRQQQRFTRTRCKPTAVFSADDVDPDYKRGETAVDDIAKLFEGVVGSEDLVEQLQGYQNAVANSKAVGMDPREGLPFTFLFRGPPGISKTTAARKMGQIYYNMGFLTTGEVVECSAKDLIGEYVGQTGPKAQKLIESALGKILFIDEAYSLGDGLFAKEGVDELVDCITKKQFLNKVVIILAGYEDEINRLMTVNPGLSSRFPESVDFKSLRPKDCFDLLRGLLAKRQQVDSTILSSPSPGFQARALDSFEQLASLENFANGRDIQTLAKGIIGSIMKKSHPTGKVLQVSEDLVIGQLQRMIDERVARARSASQLKATEPVADLGITSRTPSKAPPQPPAAPATLTSTKQYSAAELTAIRDKLGGLYPDGADRRRPARR